MLRKVTLCLCAVGLCGVGQLRADQAVQPKESPSLQLANDQVTIEFDAANGAVASIKNRSLGVDVFPGCGARLRTAQRSFADHPARDAVPGVRGVRTVC